MKQVLMEAVQQRNRIPQQSSVYRRWQACVRAQGGYIQYWGLLWNDLLISVYCYCPLKLFVLATLSLVNFVSV